MILNIALAFIVGFGVGYLSYWIALEISYNRWDKQEKERKLQRRINDLDCMIEELDRLSRKIDFNLFEGEENEGK